VIETLAGRLFGPYPLRVCNEKVMEFVTATGDQPERWREHAPPGFAAACLFVVAPHLLAEPGIAGQGVIHGEQRFHWRRPLPVEAQLSITGTVARVRSRGGVGFVNFEFRGEDATGEILSGSSLFLISGEAPAAGSSEEQAEPPPDERATNDPLGALAVRRSASRADVVRYAAATRDWNPIHWDHDSARRAGLPGVVVHGLLQVAWICSVAGSLQPGPAPLAEATFRFRSPLRPGTEARVEGSMAGELFTAKLAGGDGSEFVSATVRLSRDSDPSSTEVTG
jgi:acyl dehydratase